MLYSQINHLFHSPQAIFKDPFRGGNNILVSVNIIQVTNDLYRYCCILCYERKMEYKTDLVLFHMLKVICDAYTPQGEPIPTNKRHKAAEIFSNSKVVAEVPW